MVCGTSKTIIPQMQEEIVLFGRVRLQSVDMQLIYVKPSTETNLNICSLEFLAFYVTKLGSPRTADNNKLWREG